VRMFDVPNFALVEVLCGKVHFCDARFICRTKEMAFLHKYSPVHVNKCEHRTLCLKFISK
jgi:hypothetical protein